jgi:hypothetical protein
MKQISERTLPRSRTQDSIVLSPDELARLLPSGWSTDIPLVFSKCLVCDKSGCG